MPIKYIKRITRSMVQREPEARFVFGDNLKRIGLLGQAAAMRGEPNAIGVATKRYPDRHESSYFSDTSAKDREAVDRDLELVRVALCEEGRTVYAPFDGIGTGLSELPTRAPKLYEHIVKTFKAFEGESCPWGDTQ